MSASVKILPCTCRHDMQDSTYGESQRVHNKEDAGFRCGNCGALKELPKPEPKKK